MKKVCLIGYPAKHSLSPAIHGYWLEKYGIEGKYEIRETNPENFDNFFRNLHEEGYVGCNITVPFKERAFELKDGLEKEYNNFQIGQVADWAKAANTVVIRDGRKIVSNTDFLGFYDSIIKTYSDFNLKKGKVVILGAGGAARGIVQALIFANAPEIVILNRTQDKSEQIINEIYEPQIRKKFTTIPWEQRSAALKNANLLVNTTSLGMVGQPPLDIDLSLLPKDALVTDIVYRPLITPLLQAAKDRGNPIVDGLGMLLYQAVPGFEMWFAEELAELKKNDPTFKGVEVTPELRKKIESLL